MILSLSGLSQSSCRVLLLSGMSTLSGMALFDPASASPMVLFTVLVRSLTTTALLALLPRLGSGGGLVPLYMCTGLNHHRLTATSKPKCQLSESHCLDS